MGLTKEPKKLERVISGLFIFELNEDNSKYWFILLKIWKLLNDLNLKHNQMSML